MENINPQQEKKLINMIDFLWKSTMDLNAYFQLIKQFNKIESEYNTEINMSKAFYSYTYNAWILATFSELTRIYDSNGTTSLIKLMNYCEENTILITQIHNRSGKKIRDEAHISKMLKGYREEYEKASSLIKSLKVQRDKIYSHNDSKKIEDLHKVIKSNPLQMKDIERLINMVTVYLQYLYSLMTTVIKTPVVKNIDDLEETLKAVRHSVIFKKDN